MSQDARPAYRRAVFASRLPDSVKVLLLRLLEDMNHKLVVSVPRTKLADSLGVPPARISERVKVARDKGYLDQVSPGRPGFTAVYQGFAQPGVRGTDSVPLGVRPPVPSRGTGSVPLNGLDRSVLGVRPDHTQVRETAASDANQRGRLRDVGQEEPECAAHGWERCPDDCANADRRGIA